MAIMLPQQIEERTYSIAIETPLGGVYTIKAWRERRLVDSQGHPVLDEQGHPIIVGRRVIERTISPQDPEAIHIAQLVAAKIDAWAQE